MNTIDNNNQTSSSTFVGGVFRFTGRMAYCGTQAITGIALMTIGISGLYLNYTKLHQFYFEGKQGKGYNDVPFFEPACNYTTNLYNTYILKLNDPESFCKNLGEKPFSSQEGLANVAALAATLGGSALAAYLCVCATTGGASLIGRSFDNFLKSL